MKSETIASIDNIKKLWTLKLIVDSGSLRKAAQRAKVSPAAISQTLSALEKIYKKPLLRRNNNSIEPTKDAKELLDWISPVFSALDNLDIKLRSAPPIAYVNLGLPEDFSMKYSPLLFKSLRAVLPSIKLTIFNERSESLIKALRQGKLCSAVIVADEFILDSFYTKTVYKDELGFFVRSFPRRKGFF